MKISPILCFHELFKKDVNNVFYQMYFLNLQIVYGQRIKAQPLWPYVNLTSIESPSKFFFLRRHKLKAHASIFSCGDTNRNRPQVIFLAETQNESPRKFCFLWRHKLFVSAIFLTSRVSTRKKTCVHTNTKLKNLRMHTVSTKNKTCVHTKSGAIKSDPFERRRKN